MKSLFRITLLITCMMLASGAFTSCEFDTSPEYDHPLYVTYAISAGNLEFVGPEQLLVDMSAWIKSNQIVYDKQVNYSTGDASEFAKTDAEAIQQYGTFLPKFKAYLDEVRGKLADGTYGELTEPVKAIFYVSASRTQGKEGHLKYEQITFNYPE